MILDYVASTGAFTVRVDRSDKELVKTMMEEHGFDFSATAGVLFTKEPYAAVNFIKDATPFARAQLKGIDDRIKSSWKADSNAHIKCPMDQELWPFQRASVEYCLQRDYSLVGDQPGLGKTPIGICFANEINAKRVLVLCPANIRLQWADRIREWSTMPWPYIVYPVITGRHGVHPSAQWTIVSYDLARTEEIGRALTNGLYDLVIIDEGHYLKTIDSGRTQAVFGDATGNCREAIKDANGNITDYRTLFPAISSRCGAVLVLTGTPLPNRPREAYVLSRKLCWDSIDWMSERAFNERFNPSARLEGVRKDGTTYMYTREEVGRAAELQARLRANFMVRHLKRDVMTQLKMPIYDIVRVTESKAVKAALEAESLLDIDPDAFEHSEGIQVLGHIAVVRHQMGLAMAPHVADYAAMCLDGGEDKIVIFAWHVDVLNLLQHRLNRYGLLRIDGSTSAVQKKLQVEEFIANPRKRIMLGNTLSLGTGTDGLQKVSAHALLAEPDWVPGNNEQAIDRLDRGGQNRTVHADLFVAPGSLLEKILVSALRKRQNTHLALDARAVA